MVVADVKLSNGEDVTMLQQPEETKESKPKAKQTSKTDLEDSQPNQGQSHAPAPPANPFLEALVPKRLRDLIKKIGSFKKRVRTVLMAAAIAIFCFTLYKKGVLSALVKTNLFRGLMKLLFNYDMPR